jgi:hypothetical protein
VTTGTRTESYGQRCTTYSCRPWPAPPPPGTIDSADHEFDAISDGQSHAREALPVTTDWLTTKLGAASTPHHLPAFRAGRVLDHSLAARGRSV